MSPWHSLYNSETINKILTFEIQLLPQWQLCFRKKFCLDPVYYRLNAQARTQIEPTFDGTYHILIFQVFG